MMKTMAWERGVCANRGALTAVKSYEEHDRKADSDLRIALVRHPDFPRKVRSIVVEFASTTA
jgi:hypothetical protein